MYSYLVMKKVLTRRKISIFLFLLYFVILIHIIIETKNKLNIENKIKLAKKIENYLSLVRFPHNVTRNIDKQCLRSHFWNVRHWWPNKASDNIQVNTHNKCYLDKSVAILIPYRNREKHLSVLANNLHVFLSYKNISYTLFVIELAQPTVFNRGLLLNAGYIIAKQLGSYRCFIFHDVDLIPIDNRITYSCRDNPLHMASGSSKFNGKMPYNEYFGGVTMVSDEQFERINGFSNAFFGWGGEDDDLLLRFQAKNISVERIDPSIGRYFALAHGEDDGNPVNDMRHELLNKTLERNKVDGISSLNFKVSSFNVHPLFFWYLIDVS